MDYLKLFLDNRSTSGSGTVKVYKSAILRFLKFIQKTDLEDINREDWEKYRKYLDGRNLKKSYKLNQAKYLRSFFDFVEDNLRSKHIDFFNPIPKIKFVRFNPDQGLNLKEKEEKEKDEFYTIEQMKLIFSKSNLVDYEHFMQIILLTFCGMRGSEVMSIKKDNLDLDNRYLVTGQEMNARKSQKDLYYVFPELVANMLWDYLQIHEKKYGKDVNWLFPSHFYNHKNYAKIRSLQSFLTSLNVPFKCRTHKFRHSISRFRRANNFSRGDRETLSNHSSLSLEDRIYAKIPIEKRIKIYDECFPKEYKALLLHIDSL
ncbi:tyrosine-type recombinase/integrase [Promethearchaeum syntrophicum]|uniref:Tyrosine-type recombinase/integrase n=1 Tax=Promethearchaeum syntrophicum TaxID=2594042 RepID=A0AC61ZU10_9ARCH